MQKTVIEQTALDMGRNILLACIDNNDLLYIAKLRIKQDDFQEKSQQEVWKKINKLDLENKPFDIDNVLNQTYVDSVNTSNIDSWSMSEDYHGCSIDFFKSRVDDFVNLVDRIRVYNSLVKLQKEVFDGALKTSAEIGSKLSNLATKSFELHPVHEDLKLGDHIVDDLKELASANKHGVDFGIRSIDDKLGKLCPGQMVIITARPGVGKSSIMLYAVDKFAKMGKHVVINSLEMTRKEIVQRYLAKESHVMMDRISSVIQPNEDEIKKISDALATFKGLNITIKDHGLSKISEIDAYLTMCAAKKNPVGMMVIDHFGYLQPDYPSRKGRYEDYTLISNRVKELAKKHNCVMMVLAQLNRETKKENEKPVASNLRDSGSLEQDADKIIALWRENEENRTLGVGILKNRQGQIFETKLQFYPSTMQIYEVSAYV